jgi:hypothetical protein
MPFSTLFRHDDQDFICFTPRSSHEQFNCLFVLSSGRRTWRSEFVEVVWWVPRVLLQFSILHFQFKFIDFQENLSNFFASWSANTVIMNPAGNTAEKCTKRQQIHRQNQHLTAAPRNFADDGNREHQVSFS